MTMLGRYRPFLLVVHGAKDGRAGSPLTQEGNWSTVKGIPELAPHISFSSSLFIPAVENESYDEAYLNLLKKGRV